MGQEKGYKGNCPVYQGGERLLIGPPWGGEGGSIIVQPGKEKKKRKFFRGGGKKGETCSLRT